MAKARGLVKAIDQTGKAPKDYKWSKEKERDAKKVTGKFINRESPGGSLTFHYRLYAGEPVSTYTLKDGLEYELPVGVVKHLINSCQVDETTNAVRLIDPNTYKPLYEVKKKPRFSFVSSEFSE